MHLGWCGGVLAILRTGLADLILPSHGQGFLEGMASLYPGYHAAGSIGNLIEGTLYGLGDGAVAGAVYAWIFSRFAGEAA